LPTPALVALSRVEHLGQEELAAKQLHDPSP
jgi:hypothetical protein